VFPIDEKTVIILKFSKVMASFPYYASYESNQGSLEDANYNDSGQF
jgi:hypothetical protein